MIKTITNLHQLNAVADKTFENSAELSIEDRFPPDQGYNALAEDVLDDMGHFIRSIHFLLENGSREKILETVARLRYLVEIFDIQIEDLFPLLMALLTTSDESVQCAVLFSLASVQKQNRHSLYLKTAVDDLWHRSARARLPAVNALMIAGHPSTESVLKTGMRTADAGRSAVIHNILQFRKKYNPFINQS